MKPIVDAVRRVCRCFRTQRVSLSILSERPKPKSSLDVAERFLPHSDPNDASTRLQVSLHRIEDATNTFLGRLAEAVEQAVGDATEVDSAADQLRLPFGEGEPLVLLEEHARPEDDPGAILRGTRAISTVPSNSDNPGAETSAHPDDLLCPFFANQLRGSFRAFRHVEHRQLACFTLGDGGQVVDRRKDAKVAGLANP